MTLASWFRSLARGTKRTQRSSRRPAAGSWRSAPRPAVEVLEDRTVPSTTLLTAATAVDVDHDGTVDYAYSTAQARDSHGNLLSQVRDYDYDGDGAADYIESLTQSFDSHNNPLNSVQSSDP
jgi:hemin uptake protein HemP